MELYCHGSLRYQATTTVVDSETGVDTGSSSLGLTCRGERFVKTEDQVGFVNLMTQGLTFTGLSFIIDNLFEI